jgi:DNA-binding MarR family transcriptional regulator
LNAKIFFSDFITYRLNVLAEAAIDTGEPTFSDMIGGSIREVRVLRIIDDYPGIDRSLVSRLIQSLLKQGLIERRGAPDDARRYELHATELGRSKRASAQAITIAYEQLILSPLSPEQERAFRDALDILAEWVGSNVYEKRASELHAELVHDRAPEPEPEPEPE